ncbi:MAG TPA: hypothetical protein VM305_05875 [Candidatus Limnocylindrales bacterium]|nr:hypothetical protein [Candidatus Limnocylindrales bacterium]
MTAVQRRLDIGTRNGERLLREFGAECRDARQSRLDPQRLRAGRHPPTGMILL